MIHELKIEKRWLEHLKAGDKRAEVRRHDRDFQVGDLLYLTALTEEPEWWANLPGELRRPGKTVARITHVLPAVLADGICEGYCVLSIEVEDGAP